jgi:hypothetical protein
MEIPEADIHSTLVGLETDLIRPLSLELFPAHNPLT